MMGAGFHSAKVAEGFYDADRAVATHAEETGVIEKDNTGGRSFVYGLGKKCADKDVGTAWLEDDSGAKVIEPSFEVMPTIEHRFAVQGDPAEDHSRGFAAGMRIDDGDSHGLVEGRAIFQSVADNREYAISLGSG
jgi:hypothetical protein